MADFLERAMASSAMANDFNVVSPEYQNDDKFFNYSMLQLNPVPGMR